MKNKINKEFKDYRNECGDCDDGGQDCYLSSISQLNDQRSAKATCKKCQCSYCTNAKCPPAVANKPKEAPATFTQGEWTAKGYNVVDTDGNSIATTGTSSARKYAEDIANARLIASAPDMLKALKQASEYCDLREIGEGGLSVQDIVDNAIAKAEGKEVE